MFENMSFWMCWENEIPEPQTGCNSLNFVSNKIKIGPQALHLQRRVNRVFHS